MEEYQEPEVIRTMDDNAILSNTFFRMFLGLLASAVSAFYAYYSGTYISMVTNGTYIGLAFAEIAVVIIFSLAFHKLSPTVVSILYFAYAFLNGFTLSVIFAAFEMTTIAYAFVATSLLFAVLAYMGYKTDRDISSFGTILMVTLTIGVILTIVNLFIGSTMLDVVLDWAILLIFLGLTVYDMNKIKQIANMGLCEDEKVYVYGAMQLYLDFINIFLRVLSLFGRRRD